MIFKRLLWFISFVIQEFQYEATTINDTLTNTNLESRIINGQEVNWNSTRYQVSLRLEEVDRINFGAGHECGGCIIGRNIVLTASHCIWNANIQQFRAPSEFSVVMGNVDRTLNDSNTLKLSVSKIITGEHFNPNTFRDDLAVLFLNQSIPETYAAAEVIQLNKNNDLKDGTICHVTGWGLTEENTNPLKLKIAEVPIVDRTTCSLNYGTETILDGMLCAGYMNAMRNVCFGDSGGPLVCNDQLVGLVSFGWGCARSGFPAIYTNVSFYYNWLLNQTGLLENQNNLSDYMSGANSTGTLSYSSFSIGFIVLGHLLRL